ncbi:MAG: hypothetical protein KFF49_01605, partial [Bacteroidales bacterium]|nr:hypothetical protein [Bacteroidales bacterium]
LSGEVALNPGIVVRAIKGELTLSDLVEPNDTVVFDDGFLKFIFREDSIIDYRLDDFYTSFIPASFEQTTPVATISISGIQDTLYLDPGDDIKLKKMKVISGMAGYTLTSWCSFDIRIDLRADAIDYEGSPLTESIDVPAGSTVNGSIDLANALISFDTDPAQAYNLLPIEYDITVTSSSPVYNPSDSIRFVMDMDEPEFDYARGYFGFHSEDAERDTIDLETEEFFSKLTGSVYLSSPSIKVNYLNSFGLPMRINTEVTGRNDVDEVSLDFDPVDIDYPVDTDNREVSSFFTIDKNTSSLPALISMLPYEIEYYGSATVNPEGEGAEDNIIFGDSRFIADMEIEIPMEFRIANLQLSDTTENFLISDDPEEDDPLDMLEELKFDVFVENGFPLGLSMLIELYDSTAMTVLESVNTGDLCLPAPVDAGGRVSGPISGNAEIEFTPAFLDAAKVADNIIFTFILNTTGNGTEDVKIYSDYSIAFSLAVKLKAGIKLNFNSEDQ